MATKPHIIATKQREVRDQSYLAAAVLGEKFPGIQELAVEMRFRDPEGKLTPSPMSRVFMADMRAHFDFLCPLKDCEDGGYELSSAIRRGLSNRRLAGAGQGVCQGRRPRNGEKPRTCGLELEYRVVIRDKSRIAA